MKRVYSDLTIVGGGIAGICAAITAARHGVKVALIEARDVLGGNTSSENRVHFNGSGNANKSFYAREAGIAEEVKLTVIHANPRYNFKDDYHLSDMALFQLVLNEENISLYMGTAVHSAALEDGRITEVRARKVRTEEEYVFISPLFADGSGDGILGALSGAEYRMGSEARSEFEESLAPEVASPDMMGSCILFTVGRADKPVPYVKPPFAYDYRKDGILAFCERPETGRQLPRRLDGVTGIWWLSYGGTLDPIKDDDKIDFELKRLVYGFFDYVKNSGAYEGVENYYLKWVAPHLAKRESRRFIGDYILNQNDIIGQNEFYDAVSTGGWWLDIHDPEGVFGTGLTSRFGEIHGLYNIPYRIMYSRNISNIFLLGRIVSATHVALGSLRVMQTLGAMAQAVGTAAALCCKHSLLPRDISSPEMISELRRILIRDGQYISGCKEDVGLAAGARITASATAPFENTDCDIETPLDKEYVLALPVSDKRLESVEVRIRNNTSDEQTLTVRICSSYKNDCYEISDTLEILKVRVEEGFDGYIELKPKRAVFPNNIALLLFEKSDLLSIFSSRTHLTGAPTFIAEGGVIKERFTHFTEPKTTKYASIAFRALLPASEYYSPGNLTNGIPRPLGLPNMWRAPLSGEPYFELNFDEAVDIEEIQVALNPMMQYDHFSDPIEALIKSYSISVDHSGGVYLHESKENYLALLRHRIKLSGVKRIRFTAKETYGLPYAEVFSVKVF